MSHSYRPNITKYFKIRNYDNVKITVAVAKYISFARLRCRNKATISISMNYKM